MRNVTNRGRLLIQLAVVVGSWQLFGVLAQLCYNRHLPGVPDSGRWPVASLVWLLARSAASQRPWEDVDTAIVWLAALALLFVPSLFATALAESRTSKHLAWILCVTISVWESFQTFQMQYRYMKIFRSPQDSMAVIQWLGEPLLWVMVCCAVGAFGGAILRRIIDAKRRIKGMPKSLLTSNA